VISWAIAMQTTSNLNTIYEIDDYQWLEETIERLKNREFDQLDLEHLIEELEDLGRERKNAVASLLEQIIRHYLMYQFWNEEVERNAPHWEAEIFNFKIQLNRLLTRNLQTYLEANLDKIYQSSRKYIQKKARLDNLPQKSPYTLEALLNDDHLP